MTEQKTTLTEDTKYIIYSRGEPLISSNNQEVMKDMLNVLDKDTVLVKEETITKTTIINKD